MELAVDAFETCLRLARADAEVRRRVEAQGLSFSDLSALRHLSGSRDGTMRRQDLADRLGMTPSGVTRLLAPLEKMGYVSRVSDPRDARRSLVVLTPAGAERSRDALAQAEERAGAFVERSLDAEDVATLTNLLHKLVPLS
jgi:DNA-binding MarR family transcriptional regulator